MNTNNPLYCDIEINDQWFEEAIADDDELGMCLVEQNDESMDTQSDQPETESEPMECSSDELSLALQKLNKMAFLQFMTFHMMACLVLYHISYRLAMYAMLTVVN